MDSIRMEASVTHLKSATKINIFSKIFLSIYDFLFFCTFVG
jgi:hypothetical protein